MNSIDTILKYIHESNDFVVTSHVNPDGDNIGSTLSIYYFLKKGKVNYGFLAIGIVAICLVASFVGVL